MVKKAVVAVEGPQKLTEISSFSWEHAADRVALNALQQIPGFDALLKKVVGTFGERNISMVYKAQAVRVGPSQYARIHRQLEAVCEVLDTDVPPLYISQTHLANAGAVGMDNPFIVLNSSLIELANDAEIEAVLGHEVGHIMSEHALYRTLLHLLLGYGQSFTPLISQAILPITLALLEWSRKAEVSCDRAGLLATQDLNAMLGLLCVMAGGIRGRRDELDVASFIEQSDEYRGETGLGAYYRVMGTLGQTHPFPVIRVAELRDWVDSGAYTEIMSGNYHRVGEPRPFADDAKTAGKAFSETAGRVFEDTDRYVNEALFGFMDAAKRRFTSSES
ncbi:MAG: M48 family metallopeptidase [Acidimicrobiales bacterium]